MPGGLLPNRQPGFPHFAAAAELPSRVDATCHADAHVSKHACYEGNITSMRSITLQLEFMRKVT